MHRSYAASSETLRWHACRLLGLSTRTARLVIAQHGIVMHAGLMGCWANTHTIASLLAIVEDYYFYLKDCCNTSSCTACSTSMTCMLA